MVKVGFICEGETEKAIIESEVFQFFLTTLNIQMIGSVRNPEGKPNLIRTKKSHYDSLVEEGAQIVFVLTDKDNIECFTKAKAPFNPQEKERIIIIEKTLEAWFLADSSTLSIIFKKTFFIEHPEEELYPLSKLRNLSVEITKRGIGTDKMIITKRMIREGFSIENAAKHPNCNSAKYFIKKLRELSSN